MPSAIALPTIKEIPNGEIDRAHLGGAGLAVVAVVELARAALQDLHGAPARRRRGARARVSPWLRQRRRLGPRAVLRGGLAVAVAVVAEVELGAELPDARLEQVQAVHELAPDQHLLLLVVHCRRRRHRLAVLVVVRAAAAGVGGGVRRGRGGPPPLLLLQLPQLQSIWSNTCRACKNAGQDLLNNLHCSNVDDRW